MNIPPRYDARAEIRTQLDAAMPLTRSGQSVLAIDLLSDTAGCIANLAYAETCGASLKKAERMGAFQQERQIHRMQNQWAKAGPLRGNT